MAKTKGPTGSVQNRHIYTRASYLFQAATYLANLAQQDENKEQAESQSLINTSRAILSDMRSVTLKAQIRCTPAIKRSICKFCDTLLIEGKTCRSVVENASKGGRKPWADVLVRRCGTCGHVKRFPMAEQRRKGKGGRVAEDAEREVKVS